MMEIIRNPPPGMQGEISWTTALRTIDKSTKKLGHEFPFVGMWSWALYTRRITLTSLQRNPFKLSLTLCVLWKFSDRTPPSLLSLCFSACCSLLLL